MRFIIPVVIGATIGYITNWIAIKMLFRPHYEKRIFNLHIPFTPGLIPKERSRIAKSVGEAVGEYLLSPEVVIKSLYNNKKDFIKKWVKSCINKLQKEEKSLKSLVKNLEYGNYNDLLKSIKMKITNSIYLQLSQESFKEKLIDLIEDYIFEDSKDELYSQINKKMELFLYQIYKSDEVKQELEILISNKIEELTKDERSLYEIVPEEAIDFLKGTIYEQDENIVRILRNILEDPIIELKLKEAIETIVSNNMNKIIAIFMSPEVISDKVFFAIKEYLYKPDINKNIVSIIITFIDKILENKVEDAAIIISSKIGKEEIEKISNVILESILKEENRNKAVNIIDRKIKSEETNIKKNILNFISNELERFLSSEILYNNIFLTIDIIVERIMDKPVLSIVEDIDEETIENITNLFNIISNNFIMNKLPNIVEEFNISKVVEEQINSYDIAFAEELILEIANKELKAITWLGALLGGIIGIVLPILQNI
ncbi:DUF445 family protein [Schnuerera sp.]|uniref:DUF445 family protein n=1 Tax=Schnuerera sp. TaxID=2794844 RepID=UPI002C96FA55|nr:DUF445 family protein [Schnuerera sp.]HSH35366.1 DUF445 family protein [Schnuerera sp.]